MRRELPVLAQPSWEWNCHLLINSFLTMAAAKFNPDPTQLRHPGAARCHLWLLTLQQPNKMSRFGKESTALASRFPFFHCTREENQNLNLMIYDFLSWNFSFPVFLFLWIKVNSYHAAKRTGKLIGQQVGWSQNQALQKWKRFDRQKVKFQYLWADVEASAVAEWPFL